MIFCADSYGQTTFVKHFSTKDGLPSNTCYFSMQDQKGYIWVATDAGVCRFDGKVFETFSIDNGLPDNQIVKIYEDRMGRIWFSSLNGDPSYYYKGKIFNEKNDKSLKLLNFKSVVISFFEDSNGNMWFGTNKNMLAKWDGKSTRKYVATDTSNQFITSMIYEDKLGQIWASSVNSLHVFNGETFIRASQTTQPISFRTVFNLADKTMLFLDFNGLNQRDAGKEKLLFKIDHTLLKNNPGYFYAEDKHSVWLANNSGVYHVDDKGNQNQYLTDVTANHIVKDREGNMWFTTNNGIYMLPEKSKRVYIMTRNQGLSHNGIKSVMKDQSNRLWLGMDNGMINILNEPLEIIERIRLTKNSSSAIKQMGIDSSGKTVFFASDYGLGMLNNDGKSAWKPTYLREANNFGFVLKNFSISKGNKLALAMSSGIVIIDKPLTDLSFSSSAYKEGQNFFGGRAYRVFYDKQENLKFSSTSGYSEFSAGKLIRIHGAKGMLDKRINDMVELPDRTMVMATDGYGLLFYKDKKIIRHITRENGLAGNICKKLFLKDDCVWVVTNNAVNRVLLKDNYPVEAFEFTNSMLDNDVNELFIDDKTVYFATNHGLVYFANSPFDKRQEVPKVMISSIISQKKIHNPDSSFTLSAGDNNVTFQYSAIDFQNHNILYRYRLHRGAEWTETQSKQLEFFSLEPDAYNFELSARTNNSQWSKPVTVYFILQAHFWQSFWFMLLLLVLASLSFYKIAVIITKQQKDKEQQRLLLKNKILMLEQQTLQAMINPHFVFNVMNSIQHYINTKNTSSANKILTGFARLIRKNLDICTKSYISLEEEIEYLSLYLSLEKMRFGEKFNYVITIAEDIDQDDRMIPSMILQPYIENAIWHGLMPRDEGGNLSITFRKQRPDSLLIQIVDDGVGIDNSLRTKKEKHQSKGMSLTQERVNLLNQIGADPIQISISQNGNSGTTISIVVPNW